MKCLTISFLFRSYPTPLSSLPLLPLQRPEIEVMDFNSYEARISVDVYCPDEIDTSFAVRTVCVYLRSLSLSHNIPPYSYCHSLSLSLSLTVTLPHCHSLSLSLSLTVTLSHSHCHSLSLQDIGGMEEELAEVRDNVVLPMQMWKIFKGTYACSCVRSCVRSYVR